MAARSPSASLGRVAKFPSLKSGTLLAILQGEPLNYVEVRRSGSHRHLVASGRDPLTFAFHDGVEVPPHLVRKILVKSAGLSEAEALELL